MKITTVKQQLKNPERASIFVDGKYSFSLSLNELVVEKLKNGFELDEPALERLKKLSVDGKLNGRALEWVLGRPHSTRELRDYLRRKKADPELVDAWIEEFTDRKYLNDASYAAWRIDVRRRGGKSERAIRSELMGKGVPRDILDEQLHEGKDEQARLKEVITKKQKLARYKADPQKLMRYLVGHGFGYDDIKRALAGDED